MVLDMKKSYSKFLPLLWVLMSLLIVMLDKLTGPEIRFPILFVIPVILATWFSGKWWGVFLAVILPLIRLFFFIGPESTGALLILMANSVIRITVLAIIALLIAHLMHLRMQVQVLERFLPICSFCKKIRREDNTWTQVESYFSSVDKVKFSHGLCPDCAEKHYGEILHTKGEQ